MRIFTRITSSLVALFMLLSLSVKADIKEVTILHTNDIESVYEPIEASWRDDIELMGGMAHLATLIKQVREQESLSFVMDAGDIYTGALSKKTKGKLPFDLYNAAGYDVVNIGNHEFEYGWQSLVETKPRAAFPVLNANIVHKLSDTLIAQPYAIIERGGVRIGVVGVMGVDAFVNASAVFHRAELRIKDPTKEAQYWVDKIRADVDMVVVLTHQNKTAPMQTNKESDASVQRGFEEDYAMAGKLKGVDVILGGHSDNGLEKPVVHPKTGTVIGMTFGQGMHLGYMKFEVDKQAKKVKFISGKLIPVDAGKLAPDASTSNLIHQQRKQFPELSEQAAILKKAAPRRYNQESSIGNLITDFMRSSSKSDIAMINSGAIRADFNAGKITREHIMNVYPFMDELTVVELSAKQVKELVEYSLTIPYGIGQFSGINIRYDSSKPQMQKLISIEVNGKVLSDNKTYTVATTAFVAKGGDGYKIFTEGKTIASEMMMSDILFDGFSASQTIEPPALGRQKDMNQQR